MVMNQTRAQVKQVMNQPRAKVKARQVMIMIIKKKIKI
jgi:hypothetical protein